LGYGYFLNAEGAEKRRGPQSEAWRRGRGFHLAVIRVTSLHDIK